jgi:hypothetical protein
MADTTISQLSLNAALTANNFIPISDGTSTTKCGTDSLFGFRNRIINGGMRIDQRNNGAPLPAPQGAYTVDRWIAYQTPNGVFSAQQSAVVPNEKFQNSLLLTVTTPNFNVANGAYYALNYNIEGFDVADFGWGSAQAAAVTLSFWIRTSVPGTWVVAITNAGETRNYPATFTVTSQDAWQFVSLTIPGITSGTWNKTNGVGVALRFDLGSGSNGVADAANEWNSKISGCRTSASVNWISNTGATLYVTGVQLEKGSTATPYEFRHMSTELAMCQRYYNNFKDTYSGISLTSGAANIIRYCLVLPVEMRVGPIVSFSNVTAGFTATNLGGAANTKRINIEVSASARTDFRPQVDVTATAELVNVV